MKNDWDRYGPGISKEYTTRGAGVLGVLVCVLCSFSILLPRSLYFSADARVRNGRHEPRGGSHSLVFVSGRGVHIVLEVVIDAKRKRTEAVFFHDHTYPSTFVRILLWRGKPVQLVESCDRLDWHSDAHVRLSVALYTSKSHTEVKSQCYKEEFWVYWEQRKPVELDREGIETHADAFSQVV